MDDDRRSTILATVFSTWVVLGLFLDGWAHNAGKPEDFWTPWHAVLYSGFVAATLTFTYERARHRRAGTANPADRLTAAGFVLFGAAGVGDAVWHGIFGIEEDVAALLSPTHLALMLGGLLLIGGPLRRAHDDTVDREARWRSGYPDVVAIALAVAVVGFFLQFVSAFHGSQTERYGSAATATGELLGVAGLLVTNVLLLGAVAAIVGRRDRLPAGATTVVLTAVALLLTSLEAFEAVALAPAAALAGVTADALLRRDAEARTVLLATPAVLWLGWFALYDLRWGLAWPAEYWTGTVVLTVLTGWGIALLVRGDAQSADAPAPTPLTPRVEAEVPPADRRASASVAGGW